MTNKIQVSLLHWGQHNDKPVYLFKLENASGAYIELTNYGATLVAAVMPGKNGDRYNAILGFDSLQAYINDDCYIGSTIGRYANRISNAGFNLGDKAYQLTVNDNRHTNHGGRNGFNTKVFDYEIKPGGVDLIYQSCDGEEGFPGNLHLKVSYMLSDLNEIMINYQATSDKKTVANFTNHAYFNLGSDQKMVDHQLTVYADEIVETNKEYIPTGLIKPAGNLKFQNSPIRDKLKTIDGNTEGVNNCYILKNQSVSTLVLAAQLVEAGYGRKLEVYTTYPSLMVYTGDFLHSDGPGHLLKPYDCFGGICLECQYYPDSPNQNHFPSVTLEPGELFDHTIIYKFGNLI